MIHPETRIESVSGFGAAERTVSAHLEERGHVGGRLDILSSAESLLERSESDRSSDCEWQEAPSQTQTR